MDTPPVTCAEVEETFEALSKKFALLLVASELSEDAQDALIGAVPYLEINQIVHLVNLLEAKYAASSTRNVEADLVQKLEAIAADFAERQKERDHALLVNLHELTARMTA